jgi:dinuclear metal center YbgI/SA1388 family protein
MTSPTAATPTLAQVVDVLDRLYPPAWAEEWDAVGLVCGDPAARVGSVLLAVDPRPEVAAEAVQAGADLLLVHHPLLLSGVTSVAATTPAGAVVHDLVRAGCALFTAHTNADRARPGVSDALARVLGLMHLEPLVPLPPGLADAAADGGADVDGAGLGRVGTLERAMTLRAFAAVVADALPATAQGVRVAGPADAPVRRVAVCGGSGGSLAAAAAAAGADVLVTADLRHHTAADARDAADAASSGPRGTGRPHLVDVAHWASEWPWLHGAAERLAAALGERGLHVELEVSRRRTDPWSFHLPSGRAGDAGAAAAGGPGVA